MVEEIKDAFKYEAQRACVIDDHLPLIDLFVWVFVCGRIRVFSSTN